MDPNGQAPVPAPDDPDAALLRAITQGKYVRPEHRQTPIPKAVFNAVSSRTPLSPDAPAPKTDAILANSQLEPSSLALQAWLARVDGTPLIDLAHSLGVSITTARKLLDDVNTAIHEDLKANLQLNRSLDLARIDALIASYFHPARQGDLDAARLVLKCLQQRAELTGSAAPKIHPHSQGPQNVLVWIQNQLPNINKLVDALPPP